MVEIRVRVEVRVGVRVRVGFRVRVTAQTIGEELGQRGVAVRHLVRVRLG